MIKRCNEVYTKQELEKLHTKQLLNRRDFFYKLWKKDGAFRNSYDDYDDCFPSDLYKGTEAEAKQEQQEVHDILATREHVPNKEEAKEIRQARAKLQRS